MARKERLRGPSAKGIQKRRANQLKVGVKLVYDAGKANVKLYTWVGMTAASGTMWITGKTLEVIGVASQAIGGGLVKVADGIGKFSTWLFG